MFERKRQLPVNAQLNSTRRGTSGSCTCNPSYSGGKDQEDHGLKPAWANSSSETLPPKNPSQKRAGRVAQGVSPEFKPQYCKKKKKKKSTEKVPFLFHLKIFGTCLLLRRSRRKTNKYLLFTP
jgi:hypothetical protein